MKNIYQFEELISFRDVQYGQPGHYGVIVSCSQMMPNLHEIPSLVHERF